MTHYNRHQQRAAGRLRLAHRLLPLRASDLPQTRWNASPSRAAVLAQAIQARYRLSTAGYRSPARVWRQARLARLARQISHHHHLSLAPSLALTVLFGPVTQIVRARPQMPSAAATVWFRRPTWASNRQALSVRTPAGPAPVTSLLLRPASIYLPHRGGASIPPSVRTQLPVFQTLSAVQMQARLIYTVRPRVTERLVERLERVTSVIVQDGPPDLTGRPAQAVTPAASGSLQRGLASGPVPRMVYRPSVAPAAVNEPPAPPSRFASTERRVGPPEMASAVADVLPPFQVNRLADQVVQIIDQRATAFRERLGRI